MSVSDQLCDRNYKIPSSSPSGDKGSEEQGSALQAAGAEQRGVLQDADGGCTGTDR